AVELPRDLAGASLPRLLEPRQVHAPVAPPPHGLLPRESEGPPFVAPFYLRVVALLPAAEPLLGGAGQRGVEAVVPNRVTPFVGQLEVVLALLLAEADVPALGVQLWLLAVDELHPELPDAFLDVQPPADVLRGVAVRVEGPVRDEEELHLVVRHRGCLSQRGLAPGAGGHESHQ